MMYLSIMASEPNNNDSCTPVQSAKVESISSNKKIIKSGTSEAITITKDAEVLDKHQGDELLVRLSVPSTRTIIADRLADAYLGCVYKPRNSIVPAFEVLDSSAPVQFEEEDVFAAEQASNLYVQAIQALDLIMDDYVDRDLLEFDSELGSYERFVPKVDTIKRSLYDDEEKKIRLEIRKCLIWLKYVQLVLSGPDSIRTPFKMTGDPLRHITEAIHVCQSALMKHGDDLREYIRKENIEWGIRQAAILDKDGYYVVVKVLRGSLASFTDDQYEESVKMDVIHSFSYDQLDSAMSEEMAKMAKSNRNGARYDYQIYGPFLENDAKQFKEYLYIGVKLNFKAYDSSSIFEWCRNQSEQYKQSRIRG